MQAVSPIAYDFGERGRVLGELLCNHSRIAIVGGPRTGKTLLASTVVDRPVIHTDDHRCSWAEAPASIVSACAAYDPSFFVVEGVMIARALRRGLAIDVVLYLDDAKAEQSVGQLAMSKGIATVFADWRALNRDVLVVSPDLVIHNG